MIQDNVKRIQDQIASICQKIGRNPKEITLIAVTKFAPVDKIEQALFAGISHVAENKVQEGLSKYPQLKGPGSPITRHMIGHLQSNKAKDALKVFDLIQSVDSLKLAQEIDQQAEKIGRTADILVQINTAQEEQKYGLAPEETLSLMESVSALKHLRVQGLMAMAPLTEDQEMIRDSFRKCREWRAKIALQFKGAGNIEMKYLSMGMSQDFPLAIAEGSNMVRIGSAIFK